MGCSNERRALQNQETFRLSLLLTLLLTFRMFAIDFRGELKGQGECE